MNSTLRFATLLSIILLLVSAGVSSPKSAWAAQVTFGHELLAQLKNILTSLKQNVALLQQDENIEPAAGNLGMIRILRQDDKGALLSYQTDVNLLREEPTKDNPAVFRRLNPSTYQVFVSNPNQEFVQVAQCAYSIDADTRRNCQLPPFKAANCPEPAYCKEFVKVKSREGVRLVFRFTPPSKLPAGNIRVRRIGEDDTLASAPPGTRARVDSSPTIEANPARFRKIFTGWHEVSVNPLEGYAVKVKGCSIITPGETQCFFFPVDCGSGACSKLIFLKPGEIATVVFKYIQSAQTNLIKNPGFEEVDQTGDAMGWEKNTAPRCDIQIVTDVARPGGTRSARISCPKRAPNFLSLSQIQQIRADGIYRISGWIKTENVESAEPNVGAHVSGSSPGITGTKDWTYVSFSFSPAVPQPDEPVYELVDVSLGLKAGGIYPASGVAWFDDITLVKIDE